MMFCLAHPDIPMGVAIVIALLARRRWNPTVARFGGMTVAAMTSAVLAGSAVNAWEIAAAQTYWERAALTLDGIRMRDGAYPPGLPVMQLGRPPLLLRNRRAGSYSSDGRTFRIKYDDPAQFMAGRQFDSTSRRWTYYDSFDDR